MKEAMRRSDRQLTDQETLALFQKAEYGVLSLIDPNNLPYGVPMNFALQDNTIYFHCSAEGGKKVSSIRYCKNASFTVVQNTRLLPEKFSTLYMSAIAYGTAEVIQDTAEKRIGAEALVRKYSPDYIEKGLKYIDSAIDKIFILKFKIERMTGKGLKEPLR